MDLGGKMSAIDFAHPSTAEKPKYINTLPGWRRVRLGELFADALTTHEAIELICQRAKNRAGGFVVTPNLDHLCLAEEHASIRTAYHEAFLALPDGMPMVWWAKWMGEALPEKVSGSDLLYPLCQRAAEQGLRVFFLGAPPGVAQVAASRLLHSIPRLQVCGTLAPPLGFQHVPETSARVLRQLKRAKPNLIFVALGCPKQETWMRAHYRALAPAVLLGVGAAIEFVAGTQVRAPAWVSRVGLEWLHRLLHNPKRLWHRYLVRDKAALAILMRSLQVPAEARARFFRPPIPSATPSADFSTFPDMH